MGMEGILRRVSEFELAGFRGEPGKFYSGLATISPQVSSLHELTQRLQQSELFRRIRERALSGAAPFQKMWSYTGASCKRFMRKQACRRKIWAPR